MEDWLKCQISPLIKYRQNQNQTFTLSRSMNCIYKYILQVRLLSCMQHYSMLYESIRSIEECISIHVFILSITLDLPGDRSSRMCMAMVKLENNFLMFPDNCSNLYRYQCVQCKSCISHLMCVWFSVKHKLDNN